MSTALVTGATAGIGLAFCRELAERGHDLVLVARDRVRLENVSDELSATYKVGAEILAADLSDRAQVQRVADRLADAARPVDLLVNNAGFGMSHSFLGGDLADEERMLDVLCRAVLVLSHAAARPMRARGHGAIVNVSSVAGFVADGHLLRGQGVVHRVHRGPRQRARRHRRHRDGAAARGSPTPSCTQRADLDMSRLPDFLWLEADRLVRDCLDDVRAGKVVSVPGAQYKALVGALQVLPRGLVRRASGTGRPCAAAAAEPAPAAAPA